MVIEATKPAILADIPADLKARLALAALQGEPAPWSRPEARQAGVTPADVAAWQGMLTAGAVKLFVPQRPEMADSVKQERDALQAQLALRFEELAVLTRLLSGRSRLFPRLTRDRIRQMLAPALDWRRNMSHRLGTLQIRIVSALPRSWKSRVKAMVARIRA